MIRGRGGIQETLNLICSGPADAGSGGRHSVSRTALVDHSEPLVAGAVRGSRYIKMRVERLTELTFVTGAAAFKAECAAVLQR